tara:strand:- start:1789 stop:1998 length:210 start_codon:yes stop_codon:yes gene_type:complete
MSEITIIIMAVLFCANSVGCLYFGHYITAKMLNKPTALGKPSKLKITAPNGKPVFRDDDLAIIPDSMDT